MAYGSERYIVKPGPRATWLWEVEDMDTASNHRIVCRCERDVDAILIARLMNKTSQRRPA